MRRLILSFGVLILLGTGASPAVAEMITFDDLHLGNGDPLLGIYKGYYWGNTWLVSTLDSSVNPAYKAGVVSGPNAILPGEAGGAIVKPRMELFSFGGAYMTSPYLDQLPIRVMGYVRNTLKFGETVIAGKAPRFFDFNYKGIDELRFFPQSFTPHGDFPSVFVMDNVVLSTVPAPPTIVLMGIGILGLFGYKTLRRRTSRLHPDVCATADV